MTRTAGGQSRHCPAFSASRRLTAAAVAAVALAATACGSNGAGGSSGPQAFSSQFDSKLVAAAQAEALKDAGGTKQSGSVSFVWQTSGEENKLLVNLLKTFTEGSGIQVDVQSDPSMQTNLKAKVQAGDPPDVFLDSSSGDMLEYQGKLVALDGILDMNEFKSNYAEGEISAVSQGGHVYGVPGNRNAMEIYYDPKTYTGPKTDVTMTALTAWAEQQVAEKKTAPVCGALSSGAFTANNASQFIDEIFAKKYGAQALQDLASGKLAYNSPQMKDAWQTYIDWYQKGLVYGGATYALSQPITSGPTNLISDPQKCQVLPWGPYTQSFIETANPNLKAGTDFDYFNLASEGDAATQDPIFQETGGWVTMAFNDTPQVRAFMKFFASTAFQTLVASTGHWLMANKNVPTSTYPTTLLKRLAEQRNSSTPVVGPFGTFPPTIRLTVFSNLVTAISDPAKIDDSLNAIQSAYSTYRAQHGE